MPQTPTANMGLIQPTEGGDDNVWDTLLTAVFTLIDQHQHAPGKGVKVPTAGLNINADLSFAGAYALTNLLAADFTPTTTASVAALAGAFFVNSGDSNNLYWRNPSGTNVKVIDGNTLNVAGFAGGIGGDYSSASALVAYVAASDLYTFKGPDPGGGRPWEALATGHHDFYEQGTTVANRVRIQSPAALAASYTLTLPTALPAAAGIVQCSTSGVLSASIILPRSPGFTAEEEIRIPWCAASPTFPTSTGTPPTSVGFWSVGASDSDPVYYPVAIPVGCRIKSYSMRVRKQTNAGTTITATLYRNETTGNTVIGSSQASSANNPGYIGLGQTGLTETVITAASYFLEVASTAVGAGDEYHELVITYDRPT